MFFNIFENIGYLKKKENLLVLIPQNSQTILTFSKVFAIHVHATEKRQLG